MDDRSQDESKDVLVKLAYWLRKEREEKKGAKPGWRMAGY